MAAPGTQLEKRAPAGESGQLQAGVAALWTRARLGWTAMLPQQRSWAFAAAGILVILWVGMLWYGLRTDWRTLYAGLDPDDARQVGLTLTQAQISYDVADNGTTLRVPGAQLDKAGSRLQQKVSKAAEWDSNFSTNRTGLGRSLMSR